MKIQGTVHCGYSISPLITLREQWPPELDKEPIENIYTIGTSLGGSSFCQTTKNDPQNYYKKYMVPNVIQPALNKLTNHYFIDHGIWSKWWGENK